MRKRKKNFNRKNLMFILAGVIGVFGITIVYAALTTTLNIVGSTEVEGNDWKISMEIINTRTEDGVWREQTPHVDGHRIRNVFFNLYVPGDYAYFEVTLNNEGKLPAELQDIIIGNPTCTSDSGNNDDEKLICDNIIITINYVDGSPIEKGDILYHMLYYSSNKYEKTGFSAICKKSDLKESMDLISYSRGGRTIAINVEYDKNINKVPSSNVTVSGIDFDFIFGQTDNDCNYVRNSMFN